MTPDKLKIGRQSTTVSHTSGLRGWLNFAFILVAAALILCVAFWTVHRSEVTLENNLESKLNTVLHIEVEALRDWVESEKRHAGYLASDEELVRAMADAASGQTGQAISEFKADLLEIARRLETKNCILMTTHGEVIAESGQDWLANQIPLLEDQFCESLLSGNPTVSQPFVPIVKEHPNLNQNDSDARSNTARNSQRDFVLVIAAPIVDQHRGTVGFLGIGYEISEQFTHLLRSSRYGKTGETLVVNAQGQLISNSRFQDDSGSRVTRSRSIESLDLESLFGAATDSSLPDQTKTGVNVDGLKDHRDAIVVGAGSWLPQLGFGVITKIDRSEATAPIIQIRMFLWTLCAMLLATTIAACFYRWYVHCSQTAARQQELIRKRLGAYELEEKVGEGGMGVVYRARHELLRRPTAVKILPPDKSSQKAIERFEREVYFTSQLKHPNTISIYDFGRTDHGLFYYAMEYLDGLNLDQLVAREGSLPDGRVIHILKQVCESLAEAHHLGLVHRDIKPANVMLCERGGAVDIVKVLDFGMVRDRAAATGNYDGRLSGTPAYMAPEAFSDPSKVDFRADIFAIGAVGFFLLTGQPLIQAADFSEILKAHQTNLEAGVMRRLEEFAFESEHSICPELISLIANCVATDRRDRIQSVDKLFDKLDRCVPVQNWSRGDAIDWWELKAGDCDAGHQSISLVADQPAPALVETVTIEFEPPKSTRITNRNKYRFFESIVY